MTFGRLAANDQGLLQYRQPMFRLPGKLFKSLVKNKCSMTAHQPV
jgi:hypothetical protein